MGSRPWECETTKNLLEKIRLCDHLVLICNYENILQAKNLARLYHHRIYCFPLDADPFRMTREKRKFLRSCCIRKGGEKTEWIFI